MLQWCLVGKNKFYQGQVKVGEKEGEKEKKEGENEDDEEGGEQADEEFSDDGDYNQVPQNCSIFYNTYSMLP